MAERAISPAAAATEPRFILDLLHFIHGIMGNPAARVQRTEA